MLAKCGPQFLGQINKAWILPVISLADCVFYFLLCYTGGTAIPWSVVPPSPPWWILTEMFKRSQGAESLISSITYACTDNSVKIFVYMYVCLPMVDLLLLT